MLWLGGRATFRSSQRRTRQDWVLCSVGQHRFVFPASRRAIIDSNVLIHRRIPCFGQFVGGLFVDDAHLPVYVLEKLFILTVWCSFLFGFLMVWGCFSSTGITVRRGLFWNQVHRGEGNGALDTQFAFSKGALGQLFGFLVIVVFLLL